MMGRIYFQQVFRPEHCGKLRRAVRTTGRTYSGITLYFPHYGRCYWGLDVSPLLNYGTGTRRLSHYYFIDIPALRRLVAILIRARGVGTVIALRLWLSVGDF
jgi:hypothetical protein